MTHATNNYLMTWYAIRQIYWIDGNKRKNEGRLKKTVINLVNQAMHSGCSQCLKANGPRDRNVHLVEMLFYHGLINDEIVRKFPNWKMPCSICNKFPWKMPYSNCNHLDVSTFLNSLHQFMNWICSVIKFVFRHPFQLFI